MSQVSLNKAAPDFTLAKFSGEPFRLSDLREDKHVVLVFNRTFA